MADPIPVPPAPNPGWHLSDNGLKAIGVIAAVLTLFIQSWFNAREMRHTQEAIDAQIKAVRGTVDELKDRRPMVFHQKEE